MKRLIPMGILMSFFFIFLLVGCNFRNRPVNYYLYVSLSNAGVSNIASFKIDDGTGLITPVGTPVPAPKNMNIINMIPDHMGSRIYGVVDSDIGVYNINRDTGELFAQPGTISVGSGINSLALNSTDSYLYLTQSGWRNVSIVRNGNSASLYDLSTAYPNKLTMDPTGFFIYATDLTNKKLLTLKISHETGDITDVWDPDVTAELDNPNWVVAHPNGHNVYVANDSTSGKYISCFQISPFTKTLNTLSRTYLTPAFNGLLIVMDPLGRYLFVTESAGSRLRVYNFLQNGGLGTYTEVNTLSNPQSIAVTPNGKYLYAVNNSGDSISMFKIDSGTTISPIITTAYPTGIYSLPANSYPNVMVISRVLQ